MALNAKIDIMWSDDGKELLGVNLAGEPITPNQVRALRASVIAITNTNELPHAAIDAWERRLFAQESGANQGEPC